MDHKFELERFNRNVSKEEIIADIQKAAALSGASLTIESYKVHGKFSMDTCRRRFGTWNKALIAAGIAPAKVNNIPQELLFKNLEEVWLTLGRQPRLSDMEKPFSKYSGGTYEKRYGWSNSLERFVEWANNTEEETFDKSVEESERDISSSNTTEHLKHRTKRYPGPKLTIRVWQRDGHTCVYCGRSPGNERGVKLHVDHIFPWSKGGETVFENLQTLCEKCNLGKGNVE